MHRPQGYLVIADPNAPLVELDTFTCGHCQAVVPVKPRCDAAEAGGFCRCCMKLICGPCTDAGGCTPWEKALELAEAREASRRRLDAALGAA